MFGIGGTEILVILVVALMVLGPKSVPQIAKTLGKALGEFRRVSTEFQRTLNTEVELDEHEKQKKKVESEYFSGKDTVNSKESLDADESVCSAEVASAVEESLINEPLMEKHTAENVSSSNEKASV